MMQSSDTTQIPTCTTVSTEKQGNLSPITQQLIQRFRDLTPGEFISYEQLSQIANCDVRGRYRYFVEKAIQHAESNYGVVIICQRLKGYVRLKNEEISPHSNVLHKKRLISDTGRYKSKIQCVDPSKLVLSQRIEYGLAQAQVGLREAFVDKRFEQQTRKDLASSPEQRLNLPALLEDMRGFG